MTVSKAVRDVPRDPRRGIHRLIGQVGRKDAEDQRRSAFNLPSYDRTHQPANPFHLVSTSAEIVSTHLY